MSLVNTTKTDATYGVYKSILFKISFSDIRGKLYVPDYVRKNVASIGGNDGGITAPEGIYENKLEMADLNYVSMFVIACGIALVSSAIELAAVDAELAERLLNAFITFVIFKPCTVFGSLIAA